MYGSAAATSASGTACSRPVGERLTPEWDAEAEAGGEAEPEPEAGRARGAGAHLVELVGEPVPARRVGVRCAAGSRAGPAAVGHVVASADPSVVDLHSIERREM